jgi:hypothetical protein
MSYGVDLLAQLENKGFEQITVNTAIGFTATQLRPVSGNASGQGAFAALFKVETDQIRYRMDGTDPTASVGMLLEVGDSLTVFGPKNLANFKAIKVTNNALISVEYYFLP